MIGERQTVSIDGLPLSFLDANRESAGLPLLFLHGWGGSAESFQKLWNELNTGNINRRLLALDFPGFGNSPSPQESWDVSGYARCVVKYLTALRIAQVDLVAHSFGGRVAIRLLVDDPNRFRKAILLAPAGIKHEGARVKTIAKIARSCKAGIERTPLVRYFPVIRKIGYRLIGEADYVATSGVMKESFQRIIAEDLTPLLSKISHDVLLLWGEQDSSLSVDDGKMMERFIPHGRLIVLKNGRHGIQFTHPQVISEQIIHFFA